MRKVRSIFGARGRSSHRFVHPLPSPAVFGDVVLPVGEEGDQRQVQLEGTCRRERPNEPAKDVDDLPDEDALSSQVMTK